MINLSGMNEEPNQSPIDPVYEQIVQRVATVTRNALRMGRTATHIGGQIKDMVHQSLERIKDSKVMQGLKEFDSKEGGTQWPSETSPECKTAGCPPPEKKPDPLCTITHVDGSYLVVAYGTTHKSGMIRYGWSNNFKSALDNARRFTVEHDGGLVIDGQTAIGLVACKTGAWDHLTFTQHDAGYAVRFYKQRDESVGPFSGASGTFDECLSWIRSYYPNGAAEPVVQGRQSVDISYSVKPITTKEQTKATATGQQAFGEIIQKTPSAAKSDADQLEAITREYKHRGVIIDTLRKNVHDQQETIHRLTDDRDALLKEKFELHERLKEANHLLASAKDPGDDQIKTIAALRQDLISKDQAIHMLSGRLTAIAELVGPLG